MGIPLVKEEILKGVISREIRDMAPFFCGSLPIVVNRRGEVYEKTDLTWTHRSVEVRVRSLFLSQS